MIARNLLTEPWQKERLRAFFGGEPVHQLATHLVAQRGICLVPEDRKTEGLMLPMSVRDKGPLFIIYPFDESEDLRSERYYSRSAWQLKHLEVE